MRLNKLRVIGCMAWLLMDLALGIAAVPSLVAPVFTDHMVLQQGMSVPVWGVAKAGTRISVEFSGQTKTTSAGADGKWMIKLDPLTGSFESKDLVILALGQSDRVVLKDVVVGEVWIASGGTNMANTAADLLALANPKIAKYKREPQIKLEKQVNEEIAAANQNIRLFVQGHPNLVRDKPELINWQICSPTSLPSSSFIAYSFGKHLFKEKNVPVGLITAAVNGSRIETWITKEAFESHEFFKDKPVTNGKRGSQAVEISYKFSLQPLIPFATRGILWFQGEQDIWFGASPRDYQKKLELMVQSLRKSWGQDNLFFVMGQLSAARIYGGKDSESPMGVTLLPAYQDAQRRVASLPHTGLVVTSDLTDDTATYCPMNRWEIARRFWLWAAKECYGKNDVASGPLYKGLEIKDSKAILSFDHCGSGLIGAQDRPLRYFQICGPNGAYYPAQANIEGATVVVSNSEVMHPVSVRYGWHQTAPLSLSNKEGLLGSVFSTEDQVPEKSALMAATLPEAGIVKSPIPDKTVVITFDDACLSQFTFAAPVLKKYGFGATYFVCEYPVRTTEKRDELYMTWTQIKELNDMGFEIGNHSMYHPDALAKLPKEKIIEEIEAVENQCLKNGIPNPVSFAYPNYSSSEEVLNIIKERGYLWGRSGGSLYEPTQNHSLMVPCVILPNKPMEKTVEKLNEYIDQAKDGKALILLFHGVPDKPHPWVTFDQVNFENCMKILKESGCTVVALRDLSKYVDSKRAMDYFQPIWRD